MKEISLNDKLKHRFEDWILSRHGKPTEELITYHLEKAVQNRLNDWEAGKPFPPVFVDFNNLQEVFDFEVEMAITTYLDKP